MKAKEIRLEKVNGDWHLMSPVGATKTACGDSVRYSTQRKFLQRARKYDLCPRCLETAEHYRKMKLSW